MALRRPAGPVQRGGRAWFRITRLEREVHPYSHDCAQFNQRPRGQVPARCRRGSGGASPRLRPDQVVNAPYEPSTRTSSTCEPSASRASLTGGREAGPSMSATNM